MKIQNKNSLGGGKVGGGGLRGVRVAVGGQGTCER